VKPKYGGTDWLNPTAYNALSREDKMALAARRQQEQRIRKPKQGRRNRRRRFGGYLRYQGTILIITIGAIFAFGWLSESGLSLPNLRPKSAPTLARFGYCHVGGGTNCVVDGDTFWLNGVDIRIADIDAPETHEYRCSEERNLGDRATKRLHDLLESGPIILQPIDRDEDVYGRKLRLVYVNGTSVGEVLVNEGLAHRYVRGKLPWC
jgi:endonuclease YncB( thermonuclease family)